MSRCAPRDPDIAHLSDLKCVLIEICFVQQNSNFGSLLIRTLARRSGTPPKSKTGDENETSRLQMKHLSKTPEETVSG